MSTAHSTLAFLDVGGPELLVIFVLILVLFGGKRLPELARGLGKSIREFKKATAGVEEQLKKAMDEDPAPARPRRRPRPPSAQKPATDASGPAVAGAAVAASEQGAGESTPKNPQTYPDDYDNDIYVDPYVDQYHNESTPSNTDTPNTDPEKKKDEGSTDQVDGGGI